jgi:hypothetical protein
MADRLLDRQTSLLEYLTSGAAIFGNSGDTSRECPLYGIDGGLLRLEAHYSHEKRMAKIEWVLGRTLNLLGANRALVVRDFAEACPPLSPGCLENARQFHDFLLARWRNETPEPPYLPDVALFELAYAAPHRDTMRQDQAPANASGARCGAIRRHPNVEIIRCAYDIRPILEERVGETAPVRCDIRLAITALPGAVEPVVCALSCELFAVLEMLDEFVDPDIFQDTPGADELITSLVAGGILEVSR